MVTRKRNSFELHHYLDYATIIKKYPFITSLQRSLCKYLLTSHYITNEKVSKRYPPQKNTCNLKTFFLRHFSGVLHDLLPELFNYETSLNKEPFEYLFTLLNIDEEFTIIKFYDSKLKFRESSKELHHRRLTEF